MAKPFGGVIKHNPLIPYVNPQEVIEPIASARTSGGMVTSRSSDTLDPSQVFNALNCRAQYDKLSRRNGCSLFGDAKPDSESVLAIISVTQYDGTGDIFRFTKSSVYRTPDLWTAITGTLTGSASDRIQVIAAFNQIIFTNGVDEIQLINSAWTTFADLGNAPVYKYITAFDNRVIGAYLISPSGDIPVQIGTSGNANFAQWDPTVDQSAFIGQIIDSPADNEDFITGLFGFTAVMIVTRQRSIWLATKTAIPTAPLSFYCDVPGIGAGCPYATAVVPGGIIFADHRTRKVYIYSPGQQPKVISDNVEVSSNAAPAIFNNIQDPSSVFGAYNNRTNEYFLATPVMNSTSVRIWIFNLISQAWTYDEVDHISCIDEVEGVRETLVIDQLVGTINALTGTIDSLTNPISSNPLFLYGYSDGHITFDDPASDQDHEGPFVTTIISKQFALDTRDGAYTPVGGTDQYIVRTKWEFYARIDSDLVFSYSKDGGFSWRPYKTVSIVANGKENLVEINKKIKTRKFMVKIETSTGSWDLNNYEIQAYRSGPSRASSSSTV